MNVENEKLDLDEAFKKCFYIVPDYQREFVWEEKQVHQLLEDIYEEFRDRPNSEYFIGSIVVCNREMKHFEVIDGQQRLTTLYLCLCALKKLIGFSPQHVEEIRRLLFANITSSSGELESSYRLVLQYENTENLIKHISEDEELPDNMQGSSKRIIEAYQYILQFFKNNFEEDDDVKRFYGYFITKVTFIQIVAPSISDALKIFETINERGVGLNPMDLLKNLIFRQVKPEDFSKLKDEWKIVIDTLDKNKQKPLRFLRYFILANYHVRNKKGEETIREDEIYEWLTLSDNARQCDYINRPFKFVKALQENAHAYVQFSNGLDNKGNMNVYLNNIYNLSGSFRQHLILLLAGKDMEKENFDHLAKQIEVLIFHYILGRAGTKQLEGKLSGWAEELKRISNQKGSSQTSALNTFIVEELGSEVASRKYTTEHRILEYNYYSLQKYRLKYILGKIAQHIETQAWNLDPAVLDPYINRKIEIEHILPFDPIPEVKAQYEDIHGEDSYYLDSMMLGNLTLLERPINASIGRKPFTEKKEEYLKSKFLLTRSIASLENVGQNTSINRMNENLMSFEMWDEVTIKQRQEMLLNLAKEIWSIDGS